ncbi:hypothetical protein [Streptomyces anulatus]|uniref:hypothetical protein n=1 Tax=Streptomyces anulatus TaxID=1892 RepID=UPI002F90B5BC|nr:hypothetical protein OG238_42065 [Streptomyces anulatus]
MTTTEDTNYYRSRRGGAIVAAYVSAASLTTGDRAEHGRAVVEAYPLPLADPDAGDLTMVIGSVLADLYHHAEGIEDPQALLGAALMELSTTTCSVLAVLQALGDDGRPGIIACTIAAVLAYGDEHGVCVHRVTDMAYDHWTEETRAELATL